MCYPADARPPLPPIMGGSADDTELDLKASDGKAVKGFAVRAAKPTGAGIVIIPDPRGLAPFYQDLTRRFAQSGIDAVAIDYMTRHGVPSPRPENFDLMSAIRQATNEGMASDVAAGIRYLRSDAGGRVSAVFTVGFCFGGSASWRQSAEQPDLAGAIGFYGRPERARDVISGMKAPLLLLVAGADQATTPEDNAAFDRELTNAKVPHKSVVYPGAPHSFFDRSFEQHKDASDDAWRQMLAFIKEHTRQPARA